MDITELRQLSEQELKRMLLESREKLRELRFKATRREVKNVREIRDIKKTVSRILTILRNTK